MLKVALFMGVMGILMALAVLFAWRGSLPCLIADIVLLFFAVCFLPCCRGHENIWMFVLVAWTGIPINVKLVRMITGVLQMDEGMFPLVLLREILLYIIVFCIEELVLGVLTRLIWRRQKRIQF